MAKIIEIHALKYITLAEEWTNQLERMGKGICVGGE